METRSKLYFEAHVTIEPVFDARRDQAGVLARMFGFKLADLLMKKRQVETAERSAHDTFMTGHGQVLEDLTERTRALVEALQAAGFQVWRYKIEDTILDSRTDDVLGLLTKQEAA